MYRDVFTWSNPETYEIAELALELRNYGDPAKLLPTGKRKKEKKNRI